MIIAIIILSLISITSFYALYRSIKRNFELIDLLEEINEEIDTSLETLSHYYKRIDEKAKLELFSDDATIRELVEDMKQARQAVLIISEKLTGEKNDDIYVHESATKQEGRGRQR